jgi:hypothetical protein
MKFSRVLALVAILAMVGVASGSAIIPSTHNIDSLTVYTSVHGQGGFVAGKTYGTVKGEVVPGGPALSTQAIGGGTSGTHGGGAMQIIGGTGVVDITLDIFGGDRKAILIEGDGGWGSKTNYIELILYQTAYGATYDPIYQVEGNGVSTGSVWPKGLGFTNTSWLQLHVNVDIPGNTCLIELWDIDDSTGAVLPGPYKSIWSGGSPFASSVDAIEFGSNWAYYLGHGRPTFDNLVLTPEPATLGVLVLGGVLALLRRR